MRKSVLTIIVMLGFVVPPVFSCALANGGVVVHTPMLVAQSGETPQETKPSFTFLKGRWRRPDGGYVIDIKNVDATGTVDAAYFNPNPIHVSKAEAALKGGVTTLFIELRDTGYPGCTYTLSYDPQADRLSGTYYQAAIGQNFNVLFLRIK